MRRENTDRKNYVGLTYNIPIIIHNHLQYTWTTLDGAWDTFSAKICFRSFNKKSFCQKNFRNWSTGTKVPKWQSGYFLANSHFWHFCPCAWISKILSAKLLFIDCYERPITHFYSKSVSGPVQGSPCTYLIR